MPLVFAITLFLSATLLFLVQPMIGQMITPKFGGTPSVWITCMVFFQAALLVGYSYAHFFQAWLGSRRQIYVHLALLLLPFLVLPILVDENWVPDGDASPMLGVLGLLVLTVGLPFFVVSTSAPLLQKWFADTGHAGAKDPYFLYAASNLGSMIALFSYPALVEPNLELPTQGQAWMFGYVMLVALMAGCALMALRAPAPALAETKGRTVKLPGPETIQGEADRVKADLKRTRGGKSNGHKRTQTQKARLPEPEAQGPPADEKLTAGRRLRWIALAFVPSSLSLAVTTYLTTDISAIPLLWVIPLSIYLLTFILVFSKVTGWVEMRLWRFFVRSFTSQSMWARHYESSGEGMFHQGLVLILPVAILLTVFVKLASIPMDLKVAFAMHLATLFLVAMVCHGELARDRPSTRHLTEYYLLMSVGGLLGGLFNLFAPLFFSQLIEYQVSLAAACLLLPAFPMAANNRWARITDLGMPGALTSISLVLMIRPLIGFATWAQLGYPTKLPDDFDSSTAFIRLWLAWSLPQAAWMQAAVYFALAAGLAYIVFWRGRRTDRILDVVTALMVGVLTTILVVRTLAEDWNLAWLTNSGPLKSLGINAERLARIIMFGLPALICYIFVDRPVRFALCVGAMLFVGTWLEDLFTPGLLHRERNFFGVLIVRETQYGPMRYHTLNHGTTLHGMQQYVSDTELAVSAAEVLAASNPWEAGLYRNQFNEMWNDRRRALTYYNETGPIGRVFKELKRRQDERKSQGKDGSPPALAFVGLGTGTLASYAEDKQSVTFYEIDPAVIRIAMNPEYFTYLSDASQRGAEIKFVLGDARLQLARRTEDPPYALIVLDAFSSDAIPRHLLTKEALVKYKEKLAPDGIIAFHISNRHLELYPVLANLAADMGWEAIRWYDPRKIEWVKDRSDWVLLAPNKEALGDLAKDVERWPGDPSHTWHDLLHKGDVNALKTEDLKQWINFYGNRKHFQDEWPLEDADRLAKGLEKFTDAQLRMEILEKDIDPAWNKQVDLRQRVGLWTDNYSNLLSVFNWQ